MREEKIVKILTMDEKAIPDKLLYVTLAKKVLGITDATLTWLNDGEKDWLCLIPTNMGLSKSIEELNALLRSGEYIDFTPNEERIRVYNIFRSIFEQRIKMLKELKDNIARITEIIDKYIELI
ncbi:MAG: hypothetical protein QXQ50_09955 [Candidatus Bathyarchaeia archaeon]